MSAAVRILERVTYQAPFGLRLWDVATGRFLGDESLTVELAPRNRPDQRIRCARNRSGVFYANDVPGLRDFETSDPRASISPPRPFRVWVDDPAGNFLPLTFAIDLPAAGLVTSIPPHTLPPRHPAASPPVLPPSVPVLTGVPMFSSVNRSVPEGLAVIRADLRDLVTDRPAAWCVLAASIEGTPRGLGLADRDGRTAVLFPYPERPRPALASPPPATNDFHWRVELTAYPSVVAASPPAKPAGVADLAGIAASLGHPQTVYGSTQSPPLPPLLEYRVPLVAHTTTTPPGPSSFLYVSTN